MLYYDCSPYNIRLLTLLTVYRNYTSKSDSFKTKNESKMSTKSTNNQIMAQQSHFIFFILSKIDKKYF